MSSSYRRGAGGLMSDPQFASMNNTSSGGSSSSSGSIAGTGRRGNGVSNLVQLKLRSEAEERKQAERQKRDRDIIVLMMEFLQHRGYNEAAERLAFESAIPLHKFEAADNVDLPIILQEYEQFYTFKFGKTPKFVRKRRGGAGTAGSDSQSGKNTTSTLVSRKIGKNRSGSSGSGSGSSTHPVRQSSSLPRIAGGPGSGAGSGSGTSAASRSSRSSGSSASSPQSSQVSSSSTTHNNRRKTSGPIAMKRRSKSSHHIITANDAKSSQHTVDSTQSPVSPSFGVQATSVSLAARGNSTDTPAPAGSPVATQHTPRSPRERRQHSTTAAAPEDYFDQRVLRPPPQLGGDMDDLVQVIRRDIFLRNPNTRWSDVAGLEGAKQLLQEAVVMPLMYPELFTGLLKPWKGVLLYGPPGTGKTMLARAVASECKTTFFNISASSIVSKWRGDSEKLVRVLFELARYHAPSTIFIDEMDSIMSQRASGHEHEGSRRMKTELLVQMDGLAKTDDLVFVLAASNLPWDLDQAILRRLEKRILVPLPDTGGRHTILQKHLPAQDIIRKPGACEECGALDTCECPRAWEIPAVRVDKSVSHELLAERTDGYSGADIVLLCKEAAMRPVRRLMQSLRSLDLSRYSVHERRQVLLEHHRKQQQQQQQQQLQPGISIDSAPCAIATPDPDSEVDMPVRAQPVTLQDVDAALACTRPACNTKLLARYDKWQADFGSGLSGDTAVVVEADADADVGVGVE
jgi:katanin p60 ATPase-containing subunit A1